MILDIRGTKHLDRLHAQIKSLNYLKNFKKVNKASTSLFDPMLIVFWLQGTVPLTFRPDFSEAVKKFTKQFLFPAKSYSDLVAVIVFLKEHPLVNEKMLEYAVTATIINRADVSTDIILPLEVRTRRMVVQVLFKNLH